MNEQEGGFDYIAVAITGHFGERCPDYEPDCFCCEAWKRYDALKNNHRIERKLDMIIRRLESMSGGPM